MLLNSVGVYACGKCIYSDDDTDDVDGDIYVKVSRKLTNGKKNAKKLITRPIMTVTSPNSPHIALTYTKLRFDCFFDHTYPPSWS